MCNCLKDLKKKKKKRESLDDANLSLVNSSRERWSKSKQKILWTFRYQPDFLTFFTLLTTILILLFFLKSFFFFN